MNAVPQAGLPVKRSASQLGALMVMASAVCFSAKAVFAKLAYRHGADASTVLTLRMLFAVPFFALAGYLAGARPTAQPFTTREKLRLLALGSVGYYFASLFDFLGLKYVTAGLERLILFLYPTLVILMNAIWHRERITSRTGQALLLGYGGVGLVVWSDRLSGGSNVALGSTLVFMGALAYAFYLAFSQPLLVRHGSMRITSHVLVVSSCCVFTQFAVEADFARLAQPWQVIALCAATALVATVIPAFLLAAGMQRLGASRASLIGTVGPVSTLLLAYVVLDEPLTAIQLLGSGLVLLGVWMVSARPLDKARETTS